MKTIFLNQLLLFSLFCLVGCQSTETQNELKFSGKIKNEFEAEDFCSYKLSGGWHGSYSGDGVNENEFKPYSLKPGVHYIFYRDNSSYFRRKKAKIKIISFIGKSEECNKCDKDFKVKCHTCNATGEIESTLQTPCSKCGGDGRYWLIKKCTGCNGSGKETKTINKACSQCNGTGKHYCECQK